MPNEAVQLTSAPQPPAQQAAEAADNSAGGAGKANPRHDLKKTAICLAVGALGFALVAGLMAVPGGAIAAVPIVGALAGGCLVGAVISYGTYLGSLSPPLPDTPSHMTGRDMANYATSRFPAQPLLEEDNQN